MKKIKRWGGNPVLAGCSPLIKELMLLQLEPSGRFLPVLGCQDQELQGGFIDTVSGLAAKSCVCWAFNITSLLLEIVFFKEISLVLSSHICLQILVLPLPELLHAVTCSVFCFYNAFLSHFFVAPSLRAWIWLMMRWDTSVLLWWIVWPSRGNVLSHLQIHISCFTVLCGKTPCSSTTHRCHWLLSPCLQFPSPFC